jgi:hypothetical protein
MKKLLRPLIGHGHNFATRCWILTVMAVYWFHRLSAKNPDLQPVINGLNKELYYLGLACTGIILLAGTGRSFYPNDVKKIFDKGREKERRQQLLKMYLILFAVFFSGIYWRYSTVPGIAMELLYLGFVCLLIMLPLEVERSLRFRYIGNTYGKDLKELEQVWKKMMLVWHIVLLSALAAGTYFQYVTAFRL